METGLFLQTETLRLAQIHARDIFYTPLDARFNRIVRLARRAVRVRAAAISFLNDRQEWFKAVDGWDVHELPRDRSLCAALLKAAEPVLIADTHLDDRCARHALVAGPPNIRFFAAYPMCEEQSRVIGALTLFDLQPRTLDSALVETINDLGEMAQRELCIADLCDAQARLFGKLSVARRQSMLDTLTRVWNRRGGVELLAAALQNARQQGTTIGVCMLDLDHFKGINDRFGHPTGDHVLSKVAGIIVDSVRPQDVVCRYGGEEFLLILANTTPPQVQEIMERIRDRVAAAPIRTRVAQVGVTVSIGGVVSTSCAEPTPEALIALADAELYRVKHQGRNAVELAKSG